MDDLLKKSDELEDEKKYQELWDLLFEEASEDGLDDKQLVELLWRKARACFERHTNLERSDSAKEAAVRQGLALIERAEKLAPENYCCPKWHGVLLSELGAFVSTKEKIGNALVIKHLFEKAHSLKPDDQTVLYALGVWCFEVASIGWMARKIAQTLFSEVPTSSFEESILFFEQALKAGPAYKRLLLAYGKSLWGKGDKEKARAQFKACLDLETKSVDDAKMDAEAAKY